MTQLPRDGKVQDQTPLCPQKVARWPAGFRRSVGAGKDPLLQPGKGRFLRATPPVSHRPSLRRYFLRVVSNTQQMFANGAAGMELLPWVLPVVSFFSRWKTPVMVPHSVLSGHHRSGP